MPSSIREAVAAGQFRPSSGNMTQDVPEFGVAAGESQNYYGAKTTTQGALMP